MSLTMDDRTVQQHEDELNRGFADAENARAALITAVKAWYLGWVTKTAADRVRENHGRVQELGADRVKAVKAQVTALVHRADSVVDQYLGQSHPGLWSHLGNPSERPTTNTAYNDHSAAPAAGIRKAMGELGEILIEGGIEPPNVNAAHPKVWDSRTVVAGREVAAAAGVKLGEHLEPALARYQKAAEGWHHARHALHAAEDERSKNRAADLWGQ